MFNVTGGEILIILVVALIVLGPEKLPDAIRKVGRVYGEVRRMANGFQAELRDALDEPAREMRHTVDLARSTFEPMDDVGVELPLEDTGEEHLPPAPSAPAPAAPASPPGAPAAPAGEPPATGGSADGGPLGETSRP